MYLVNNFNLRLGDILWLKVNVQQFQKTVLISERNVGLIEHLNPKGIQHHQNLLKVGNCLIHLKKDKYHLNLFMIIIL